MAVKVHLIVYLGRGSGWKDANRIASLYPNHRYYLKIILLKLTLSPRFGQKNLASLLTTARTYSNITHGKIGFEEHFFLVSFSDPTPKWRKDLIHIEHFLGRTGCSMSCDCHDNAPFWHGNTSMALKCSNSWLYRAWCHMIITSKPHGVNLIGMLIFRNKNQKALDVYQTLSSFWGWGLGMRLAFFW